VETPHSAHTHTHTHHMNVWQHYNITLPVAKELPHSIIYFIYIFYIFINLVKNWQEWTHKTRVPIGRFLLTLLFIICFIIIWVLLLGQVSTTFVLNIRRISWTQLKSQNSARDVKLLLSNASLKSPNFTYNVQAHYRFATQLLTQNVLHVTSWNFQRLPN